MRGLLIALVPLLANALTCPAGEYQPVWKIFQAPHGVTEVRLLDGVVSHHRHDEKSSSHSLTQRVLKRPNSLVDYTGTKRMFAMRNGIAVVTGVHFAQNVAERTFAGPARNPRSLARVMRPLAARRIARNPRQDRN